MANKSTTRTSKIKKEHTINKNTAPVVRSRIAYETATAGIGDAQSVSRGISEIYQKVGSNSKDFEPAQQAGLMLNAIGKQLQLQSLLLRVGKRSDPKLSFYLGG